ncbi:enoyl-CoA hydratase 2, peroxisomal isoform X2 [Selaginella moellendorffii]|uniref:enoyl-CoA hydratase 2, peroxisomal isoform X2 n=1 Tax=Selaginella moellendorffii TaxID=88036 RepID=UPI000D1C4733|nr:enoyl-CoA hydratase 2, peroxisomal isoform X2 [Selaginella moellendorffii]|eukprot:XP_024537146.1 enoyl-CoA hydratase 2, peroxisomal isoform X2 [Selaginella moellendorffii]
MGMEERRHPIPPIVAEEVLTHRFPEDDLSYTEKDVALYALGVGAAAVDPIDPVELSYVYHPNGQKFIKVLPTFSVLFNNRLVGTFGDIRGLNFDPKLLLHGEQYVEIYKPLPTSARVRSSKRISGLHDKGKAALIEMELLHRDIDTGELLCLQRTLAFLRGAGGFSAGPGNPFSFSSRTSSQFPAISFNEKEFDATPPDFEFEDQIRPNQALLYRLSGDMNPLHSDPKFAADAGFQRPILHGLCTLGYAVRAIIRCCCDGDPTRIATISSRFLHHVYPGETLVTLMKKEQGESSISFKCKVKERGKVVLSGTVFLRNNTIHHSKL